MRQRKPAFRSSANQQMGPPPIGRGTSPEVGTFDVTIQKLIYGGEGLAHHEGATVFVPYVLPAEQVTVEPIEQKKKFVRARLERVVQASPERVAPECRHFGVCGGCDYQHMAYERQVQFKSEILRETLRRIGKIEWTGDIKAHTSEAWRYRNRAQWKVRPVGAPGERTSDASAETRLGIGYFRANSSALCAVEECPILAPALLKTFLALRDALAAGELPRELREIEAFTADGPGGEARVSLTATFAVMPPSGGELGGKIRAMLPQVESLLFHDPGHDRMQLFGPGFIECEAGGHKYRVGHFSFFQVNHSLTPELMHAAVESDGGEFALDLFAGVGLFSVPLAKSFRRVIAVESNPAAVRDLESNAAGAPIEIRCAEVEGFLDRLKDKPDFVVLDPPRAGLSPGAAERLAQIAPQHITYVSCEPPTLARDLGILRARGYEISDVHLFDLFPQTFHMETVVRLSRA